MSLSHRSSPAATELDRREFCKLVSLAGAGLTLGVWLPGCANPGGPGAAAAEPLALPFLRIASDNTVTVLSKHLEAGQGVWTGLSAIVAEELDAAWAQMRVESAPAKVPEYGNLAFDPKGMMQGTGGSTSIANSWEQLRKAGATARAMLIQAGAQLWGVAASEIIVQEGTVVHESSARKASFGELASRAAKVPVPGEAPLKDPKSFKIIGRDPLPRLDSRAKSTGRQQFASDVRLPGMMTAVVQRPPLFGAKVASFDASAAKSVPGVVDVVQIPRGVAVIGRDTWSAIQGRKALKVSWDDAAAEKRGTSEMLVDYRRLAGTTPTATAAQNGDAAAALGHAAKVIEAEFEFPYLAHAPMEPLSAVCRLGPDRCEIWAGSQIQTLDRMNAAQATGLKPQQVVVNTVAAGGTFGRRANGGSDFITEVASIAKATGGAYPVRLIWTREDDIQGGLYRPMNYHRIRAGLDHRGKLLAYEQRVVGQSIMAGTPFAGWIRDGLDATAAEGSAAEQYGIENALVTWTQAQSAVPVLWWRSVGHTHMAFSKEIMMDELARASGQDPAAFRMSLLEKNPRQAAVLRLAAEKSGWDAPFPKGSGRGRGLALHGSFGSVVAQVVEVTVQGSEIRVDRVVCAVDCGTVVNPDIVRAQMQSAIGFGLGAALRGRITLTGGRVDQSNFHQYEVLRLPQMPPVIEVYCVASGNPPSGVGEPGTPPIAPAVANAVFAATGIRLRKLPFDLAAARKV